MTSCSGKHLEGNWSTGEVITGDVGNQNKLKTTCHTFVLFFKETCSDVVTMRKIHFSKYSYTVICPSHTVNIKKQQNHEKCPIQTR